MSPETETLELKMKASFFKTPKDDTVMQTSTPQKDHMVDPSY